MTRRAYTAPPQAERCTGNVTLSDGSGAACMHKRTAGTDRCRQHQRVYCCPFCEHMPDGATAKACEKHSHVDTAGWQDDGVMDRWGTSQ
jgi:hypothetical protein